MHTEAMKAATNAPVSAQEFHVTHDPESTMPTFSTRVTAPSSVDGSQRLASALSRLIPSARWPRFMLIVVAGQVIAQLLPFLVIDFDRGLAIRELTMNGIKRDIASSVAILDRLPPVERADWLPRLERRNYSFELGRNAVGVPLASSDLRELGAAIVEAMRPFDSGDVLQVDQPQALGVQVRLTDGSSVLVHARWVETPVMTWAMWLLSAQVLFFSVCAWYALRLVIRPLVQLTDAANELGPDLKAQALLEAGPREVTQAARAFNAMQRRIVSYVAERVEILATISHDLQAPITRMRLRIESMDNHVDRQKFRRDLDAMTALVREGVTYARTLHGITEPACRVDIEALLESIVADYGDAGQIVVREGRAGLPLVTRPNALRRILTNLIDNSRKYGGNPIRLAVTLAVDHLVISVIDNGPGIPPEQLNAVLKPFHRLEGTRPDGTGLGLAIAHQLARAIGSDLTLHNRSEGGLEVRLAMAIVPAVRNATAWSAEALRIVST
jgi:signal transduction histidine kinase